MVGARGFEPPTSCSQSRCATRLRHAPYQGFLRLLRQELNLDKAAESLGETLPPPNPKGGGTSYALGRFELGADTPAKIGRLGGRRTVQQFEDAADQLMALKRHGNKIVGIGIAERRAGGRLA